MSPWYQDRFGTELPPVPELTAETSQESEPASSDNSVSRETTSSDATLSAAAQDPDPTAGIEQIDVPATVEPVTLQNDRLHVVIDPRGGVITEATTLEYAGQTDQEPAQLVSPGQRWYAGTITDGDTVLDMSTLVFAVEDRTATELTLSAALSGGRSVTRVFSFDDNNFIMHAETNLDGNWDDPVLTLSWNGPINDTEEPVKQLRVWPFSMFMRDTEGAYTKISYLGQGTRLTTVEGKNPDDDRVYTDEAQKIDAAKYKTPGIDEFDGELTWYAVRSKYFMSAAIPIDNLRWTAQASFSERPTGKWYDFELTKGYNDGDTAVDIFLGPISYTILKDSGHRLTEVMELSWRFIRPISIGFLWVLRMLRTFIPNWGLVIIVFSLLIKVVLYPLSHKSITSMRRMSSLQPQMTELREKYKNNPQKLQMETMELYKREGVNPFSSCLPLLLQMPVFFALYPVVGRAFELRQAMFIPGWIEDLSRPDPFYILPIAMGVSMFFQSRQTMTDPNQKAMLYVMPVMMVFLFANFSSGLTLYWFLFNILTYLQQHVHTRVTAGAS